MRNWVGNNAQGNCACEWVSLVYDFILFEFQTFSFFYVQAEHMGIGLKKAKSVDSLDKLRATVRYL